MFAARRLGLGARAALVTLSRSAAPPAAARPGPAPWFADPRRALAVSKPKAEREDGAEAPDRAARRRAWLQNMQAKYESAGAVVGRYLPRDAGVVDGFRANVLRQARAARRADQEGWHPSVQAVQALLDEDPICYQYMMGAVLASQELEGQEVTFADTDEVLAGMNFLLTYAPEWTGDPATTIIFPYIALFAGLARTTYGVDLFKYKPFNDRMQAVLRTYCAFLNSAASQYVLGGWTSDSAREYYKLDDYDEPAGGYPSWNAWFARPIKLELRPMPAKADTKAVLATNDGTVYAISRDVQADSHFWLKGQEISLKHMLKGHHVERFVGGDVLQSLLMDDDYHRWHAPISGVVRELVHVPGVYYCMADRLALAQPDWTGMEGMMDRQIAMLQYMGMVNTRGLVFIEDERTGHMACMVVIGIDEVSSVVFDVEEGQRVKRGELVGRFHVGGSTVAVCYSKGMIDRFEPDVIPHPDPTKIFEDGAQPAIQVRQKVATFH